MTRALPAQQPARGAAATVSVRVLDSASKRPVVRAAIQTPPQGGLVWTDSTGRRQLHRVPAEFELRVRCPHTKRMVGSLAHRQSVRLRAGVDTMITVLIEAAHCIERRAGDYEVTMAGHYVSGFEASLFRPCHGLPGLTWHYRGEPDAVAWVNFRDGFQQPAWPPIPDSVQYPERFVRWHGWLSGPGAYGHLGVATHEFRVDSILEVRPAAPNDCAEPPKRRLLELFAELDARLTPFTLALDSMAIALRLDSGTVRADSTFRTWRMKLAALKGLGDSTFNDSAFQVAVYPDGALGQKQRRADGHLELFTDSAANARADSIIHFLDSRGIWIARAEGDAYAQLSEQELFRRMQRFVAPATRQLLSFRASEQERPTAGDASVIVTWEELGRRLATYEAWTVQNPESPDFNEVDERRSMFLRFFLRGTDNTEIFDRRTGAVSADKRRAFRRYTAEHRNAPSGKLVAEFLVAVEADNWRQGRAVRDFYRRHDSVLGYH